MLSGALLLSYIGPETVLPLTSVLAGIGGIVLIFWRHFVLATKKCCGIFFRRRA